MKIVRSCLQCLIISCLYERKKIDILKKLIAEISKDKLEDTLCTLKGLHIYILNLSCRKDETVCPFHKLVQMFVENRCTLPYMGGPNQRLSLTTHCSRKEQKINITPETQ